MPAAAVTPLVSAGLRSEIGAIARHASVVLVGQLAVMAFGVTDTVVAGHHSATALAALSVGTAVYISVYVGLMGVLQALLPVWAELRGAQGGAQIGRSVRQSLYLWGMASLLGMALLLAPGALLQATGVPMHLQLEVRGYLTVLAWALPPALLFRLFSTLNQSLGHPRLISILQIASLGAKIPLTLWFTLGGAGLPALGAAGCAWATLVVNYALLALAVQLLRTQRIYRPYALWQRLEAPDWPVLRRFIRIGVPSGLAVMIEVTSFALMALFIARLGTLASAAHQIAANLAAVLYMVPLALGIATSTRVSFWIGADQPALARHAMACGLMATAVLAGALAAGLWWLREPLARLYVGQPAIVAAAVPLLTWVALYHLGDALQAVCVFVLRSYGIVLMPLMTYGVLLWGLGLTGGWRLAFAGLGPLPALAAPAAFWIASALALALVAGLLLMRLAWAARR